MLSAGRSIALLAIAIVLVGGSVAAQQSTVPCSSPGHRQFDFWIGDWDVTGPDGSPAGTNRIEAILGGCVLKENWVGTSGVRGESYNIYDQSRDTWHQTWVDSSGTLLVLEGSLEQGRMVLNGKGKNAKGDEIEHQIRWEKLEDGKVKQHWRVSSDGGESWTDAFLGIYSQKP